MSIAGVGFFQGFAMLSISISQPVVWSPAPGPSVAAVSAAAPVAPVQATARDAQSGAGQSGRESAAQGQAARAANGSSERNADNDKASRKGLDAAPLLPRPQPDGQQRQQDADAEKRAEQKEQQAEDTAARKLQLQDVIASAWKASAAVVDVVLGREPVSAEIEPGATVEAAPTASVQAAAAQNPTARATDDALLDLTEGREVVAYDAQGNSSLAPLEAGSLVSRHV